MRKAKETFALPALLNRIFFLLPSIAYFWAGRSVAAAAAATKKAKNVPTKMIFFPCFVLLFSLVFLFLASFFFVLAIFSFIDRAKKKKCCCRLHFVCYPPFFVTAVCVFVLCTCIFHHVQLLSARQGVHVLATPTHQKPAAGTGNPAASAMIIMKLVDETGHVGVRCMAH